MRALLTTLFIALSTHCLWAAPQSYALEADESRVAFSWDFGPDTITGKMPVAEADLIIDFANLSNSRVRVGIDVTGAKAGFPFATQAMKGPRILDASHHPIIKFVSTSVTRKEQGAVIKGNITVRGVTRPMVFSAEIFRQRGSNPNDRTRLVILLNGALNRSEFGANGWDDLAGDQVRLRILAHIRLIE